MSKIKALYIPPPKSEQSYIEILQGFIEAAHAGKFSMLKIEAVIDGEPRRACLSTGQK